VSDDASDNSTGIEVDDAAAYFGVTESSDVLHAMMAMPRDQAMVQFFHVLSDIVLRPGDFDFEAASERMQCEGGEIYYLVAGHLGLMSMPDPLLQSLGMPDSSGAVGGEALPSLAGEQKTQLEGLADPMRMMKLFAVAHQTGGGDEVINYLSSLDALLANIGGSVDALVTINKELDAALDVAGHVVPIASLATASASAATVEIPEGLELPQAPDPAPPAAEPTPAPPSVTAETAAAPPVDIVPLPGAAPPAPAPEAVSEPVPLPTVALPKVESAPAEREVVKAENERAAARVTHDAFAGAFRSELEPEPTLSVPEGTELAAEPANQPLGSDEDGEEFVSAAEHFIAADEDGSGALDVEELARATGTSVEEAAALHAEADTDGDGVVSLSEFISSPAAEKTASLPKPVAPVRRPLGNPQANTSQPVQQRPPPLAQPPVQQPVQQPPPQQGWQQPPPQQGWQQPPPQQGWQQPPQRPLVEPTIRSGVHCRGCGVGLDPYWRFCPVCGQQNLGY
jgi:hypothetical protein